MLARLLFCYVCFSCFLQAFASRSTEEVIGIYHRRRVPPCGHVFGGDCRARHLLLLPESGAKGKGNCYGILGSKPRPPSSEVESMISMMLKMHLELLWPDTLSLIRLIQTRQAQQLCVRKGAVSPLHLLLWMIDCWQSLCNAYLISKYAIVIALVCRRRYMIGLTGRVRLWSYWSYRQYW